MVHFIVGDINSGKSTRFLSMFKEQNGQIGLYSKKLYDEYNNIIGYNLVLLPDHKEILFIKLKESLSNQADAEYYSRGRFIFSKKAFEIGETYILDNLKENTVWIDEIGGLELKGLGYNSLLKTLLARDVNLVLTVRLSLLNSVLERYKIEDYNVL